MKTHQVTIVVFVRADAPVLDGHLDTMRRAAENAAPEGYNNILLSTVAQEEVRAG